MEPPRVRDLLHDDVQAEQKRGQAGSSTAAHLKGVESWLLHHGLKIDLRVKVRDAQRAPTLADERVPPRTSGEPFSKMRRPGTASSVPS